MGFGAFYTLAVGSLAHALCGVEGMLPLGSEVRRMRLIFHELSKGASRAEGSGLGHSPPHVFPLPPLKRVDGLTAAVGHGFKSLCPNLVMATLNSLYGGQWGAGERPAVTAAHRRVHARVVCALEAMVLTDEPVLSNDGLDKYLKQSEHYSGCGVVLALGVRGGVPDKAADVPLHEHLKDAFPEMSEQVVRPDSLLLASKRRPKRVKRGYTWLAPSYPDLVRRNVKAGLHCFKKPHQVARHRGIRCLAGSFAVRKDDHEDRVITDPSVNQLLDPERLPRPRFAYIPKLRCLQVPASGVLVVSKRDARHYFHRLRIGRRWRRWLCGPPVTWEVAGKRRGQRYPASCSAPMGFGPSAGWAQGLTDVVTNDASLPPDRRLHPDTVVPSTTPVWGSIVDDVWAIEHAATQLDAGVGASWMAATESSWVARGVEPNVKKSVDSALGEEIQGYYVHPFKHWVGVSIEKRRHLFQATMCVLRRRKVMVAVVDRLVGKHSFVHSARATMRSIFECTYTWLDSVRGTRRGVIRLPATVWVELAVSALLLPFCSFSLHSEWSQRVEYTDASMTGIGRAWGVAPREVVQTIARYTDHGRVYTNLSLPWSLGLTTEHKCPLRKLRLPFERIKWHKIGAPWTAAHITLSEADAVTWAAEDRLRRPGDDGCRFIHPVDSAACAGCFTKGRSSSRILNTRCQRMCAINVAGGYEVFYPWVPSAENPADEPSRRWETMGEPAAASLSGEAEQPPPSGEINLSRLPVWPEDTYFFVHLCSGPQRDNDLCYWIERLGAYHELNIVALRVDPLAHSSAYEFLFHGRGCGDLLNGQHGLFLLDLVQSKRVIGGFASPPCSTVSRARHVPLCGGRSGPRPLRSRSKVWEALPCCTDRERSAVSIGSTLYLLCLGLLGELAIAGAWTGLEHPADPGGDYPSFFATLEVKEFCRLFRLRYSELHQCMYGSASKKPTGLLLPEHCERPQLKCDRSHAHVHLQGLDQQGKYLTTPAAQYPSLFCYALAESCIQRVISVQRKGYSRPYRPKIPTTAAGKDPWFHLHDIRWKWIEPYPGFLAENLAALNTSQVSTSSGSPQQ